MNNLTKIGVKIIDLSRIESIDRVRIRSSSTKFPFGYCYKVTMFSGQVLNFELSDLDELIDEFKLKKILDEI